MVLKKGYFKQNSTFKQSVPWIFLERDYFIFTNKHHPWWVTKLITGLTCFCLINPTLALSQTMSDYLLWQWQNTQCSLKYFEQCICSRCNKQTKFCRVYVLAVSGKFSHLLLIFSSSLYPDHSRQNMGPDLNPKYLRLVLFRKIFFETVILKKSSTTGLEKKLDLLVQWGKWSKFFTSPYSSWTRP